ncbi:hypothetical protein [Acetobacter sp. DsW_063]|uniref:hypothetical protein n=1 Tax=Acetobacter sp. DsW_063 TaxID=1514894 RepID=UPI000A3D5803|nr:hypothetical protein [Acetobacter sp. DsW_063]OUJ16380.1 hypothetical protein HK28_00125 [Acetobacter sp. DsW_063]
MRLIDATFYENAPYLGSMPDDVINRYEARDNLARQVLSFVESLRRVNPDAEMEKKHGQFLQDAIDQLSEFSTTLTAEARDLLNTDNERPALRVVGGRDVEPAA